MGTLFPKTINAPRTRQMGFISLGESNALVVFDAAVSPDDRFIRLYETQRYDERINSFGYADQDLSDRIEKKRMVNTLLLDDSHFQVAGHGDDDEDVRVFTVLKRGESFSEEVRRKGKKLMWNPVTSFVPNFPLNNDCPSFGRHPQVEAIRNRFLLSKFPPWDMGSRNVLFNAKVKLTQLPDADDGSLGRIRTYELTRANLVSEESPRWPKACMKMWPWEQPLQHLFPQPPSD